MPKVLVIDDEPNLLQEIGDLLQYEGFDVVRADGGGVGIERAREHQPDIVVCDITMPGMDGFAVLNALRSDSTTVDTPFIFLSARATLTDVRSGMELGADDYVTKPFTADALVRAILTRLDRHRALRASRLRDYSHRLVMVQEHERRALADEIKSDLTDRLDELETALTVLRRLPEGAQPAVLDSVHGLVHEAAAAARGLSYALWPAALTRLGLLPALMLLFDQFDALAHLTVRFEHRDVETVADLDVAIMVYRIVQEALSNTRKYAGVDEARVRLWRDGDTLRLEVADAGAGFDVRRALSETEKSGLMTMRERAYLLDGELAIRSTPGEGTTIAGAFPVAARAGDAAHSPAASSGAPLAGLLARSVAGEPPRSGKTDPVRIALADANAVTRWGIRSLLETHPRFHVVSELADRPALARFIEDIPVDVLILSVAMLPDDAGAYPLRRLTAPRPSMRVLLLAGDDELALAASALADGAAGCVFKGRGMADLLTALHAIVGGRQYLPDGLTRMTDGPGATPASPAAGAPLSALTDREREVFYRIIAGDSNLDIAEKLSVSRRTVETHRLNLMRKLGVRGTPALIRYAIDHALIGAST